MSSGIYKITNLINKKVYVGYTTNLDKRKGYHFDDLAKNRHINQHLQASYNKYGKDNFIYSTLEECLTEMLVSREHYWATILKARNEEYGYNILPTSEDGKLNFPKESLLKALETRKKNYIKGTIKSPFKGIPRSQEIKDKIRNATLGKSKTLTEEQRKIIAERSRKLGKLAKGRKMSKKWIREMKKRVIAHYESLPKKPIIQYSKQGIFINEFSSTKEAFAKTGIRISSINRALIGARKTALGYIWKYKNIENG